MNIYNVEEEGITSDAWISIEYTNTLVSTSVISYEDFGGIMDEGWDEIIDVPEFEKTITYRRFNLDYDNMTGDIDKTSYDDYSIYGEVQLLDIEDKIVKSGELKSGDAEIFIQQKLIMMLMEIKLLLFLNHK